MPGLEEDPRHLEPTARGRGGQQKRPLGGKRQHCRALIGAGAFRRPLNGEVSRWSPAPDGRWHERPLADMEL